MTSPARCAGSANLLRGSEGLVWQLGLTESQGECSIGYNGTQITLPDLGHSADIQAGLARFQQFSVLGAHWFQGSEG